MTPRQARAARAMLGLDLKTACALASVGKRTLTEFEAGTRAISDVTEAKIKAFYISRGVSFAAQDNDREIVSIHVHGGCVEHPASKIMTKIEYIDLFEFNDVLRRINELNSIIFSLESRASISRSIIIEVMNRSGLNQNEIADRIGCSASFINAIVVGRKSLPASYSDDLQTEFSKDQFDVERALQHEKIIKKILADIKTLASQYLGVWRHIHNL
jgi:transcriptional regulator with XRE-family HTH domain